MKIFRGNGAHVNYEIKMEANNIEMLYLHNKTQTWTCMTSRNRDMYSNAYKLTATEK